MTRADILSQWESIAAFQAISTPRRIRLADYGKNAAQYGIVRGPAWDFVEISHRADTVVFAGLNGATAASSTSTTAQVPTPDGTPIFSIFHTTPLSIYTRATSLSLQAAGATAVSVSIRLGRY